MIRIISHGLSNEKKSSLSFYLIPFFLFLLLFLLCVFLTVLVVACFIVINELSATNKY